MNFSPESRMMVQFLVACGAIGIFVVLCVAGNFYTPLTPDQYQEKWVRACIDDHSAYGCFERIVRDTHDSDELKKTTLSFLARNTDPAAMLGTCTLKSKVDCAFHIVDFGVLSQGAFDTYTGGWDEFDRRAEQASHCRRARCLSDKVPLPDVDWAPGA